MQEKMSHCALVAMLCSLPLAVGWVILGDREEVQIVCAGKEFSLPVYSTSRTVTFTPNTAGPRRVLLEKTIVNDARFEWTKDKMLVLKNVTHADQGLYSIKLSSGFTYETVRLTVSECIKSYYRNYGENFEHNIPENGFVLEFAPRGAPAEAMPIVLWNRTDPDTGIVGRGRLLRDRRVWVADRVTQADQGNYTVRDAEGKVLSRSTLTVRGHTFNVTRFTKESLNLPLFLPVPRAYLIFTPTRHPDESSLGPFDSKPPRGPVQLMREGHITDHDMRYRGLVSVGRNGSVNEVVIARLTSRHDGVYEIRDINGNLVSSTLLQVIERGGRWRALLKSITVPSGMFVSLAGFILFMKRYPNCSLSQIIACLRTNRTPQAQPPRVNIQNYSQPSPQPAGYYNHGQQQGTPRKWTPRASPVHTGYTPVTVGTPPWLTPVHARAENVEGQRSPSLSSPCRNSSAEEIPHEEERRISFPVAGASDCLQSSEGCVQFQINKKAVQERQSNTNEFYSALPLDTDTSDACSVYTSEKLNFL
ncbi:uncharacterized protein LOC133408181 isoform X2 [Phycodurus eques]|uniref:uncharacterized protein LOC133408181 isoform X2 n=1 Tax=Phycodurus eques TaxID=693459 RepID=UPI002ACD5D72|nr:uncharacterized protein LOC133408181 isoform X2 [Phycodurus eques]